MDPDTLEDVPRGEQGELWFRSKQLMKGYHNKPEATAEAITEDGWFRTGDMGKVDDDGYLWLSIDRGLVRLDREEFAKASADAGHRLQHEPLGRCLGQLGNGELLLEPEDRTLPSQGVSNSR